MTHLNTTLLLICTAAVLALQTESKPFLSYNSPRQTLAFGSFFNFPGSKSVTSSSTTGKLELENLLLSTINENDKRLDNSNAINDIVEQLELSSYGISQPAISSQVKGKWKLLHTNNADTASPIQRKAVDASKYNIYQDIIIRNVEDQTTGENVDRLIVSQVVKFGENAQLAVDALASTSEYPLEELTERKGTGKILGLNILGVSKVGDDAQEDDERPDSRIDFVFDEGNFDFNGLNIPYPVPFRLPLFRDAVKGWIDITYLSDRIRISRGNKGTTFVLVKDDDEA